MSTALAERAEAAHAKGLCPNCGQPMRQRSMDHHKLFFAFIREVYSHWPEAHPFQPRNAEHLRGWLLIEAGHYEETEIEHRSVAFIVSVAKAIYALVSGRVHCMRMFPTKRGVMVRVSKPFDTGTVGKRAFEDIARAVFDYCHDNLGMDVEEMKRRAKWGGA